jgi:hypothetical protein
MTWSVRAVVFALFVATLVPDHVLGEEREPGLAAAPGDSSASRGSLAMSRAYTFPSARDQFRVWAFNALGPAAIAGNIVGASWRQWVTDEPAEWETDKRGFAQRFGTGSLTTFTSETSLSLVSAAMRQDAGYYRSPRTGFKPRLVHAVAMTFVARDRDGNAVFSPGKTFTPFVGPVVTMTTLYPERYSYADGLVSGAYGLLINAAWNAAREFVVGAPVWGGGRPVRALRPAPAPTR